MEAVVTGFVRASESVINREWTLPASASASRLPDRRGVARRRRRRSSLSLTLMRTPRRFVTLRIHFAYRLINSPQRKTKQDDDTVYQICKNDKFISPPQNN